MAATFAQAKTTATTTSATTTHTMASQSINSLTDGIGLVAIERNDGANSNDVVTGVTWGGVAMTRVGTITNTQPFAVRLYLYAISAPATGTVTITATSSSNINTRLWWMTIENAAQQAAEASNTASTINSTSLLPAVTSLTNDALVVGVGVARSNSNTPTANADTTIRMNDSNAWFSWTEPSPTAGSITSGFTGLSTGSDSMAVVASFAPVGGGGYRFVPQIRPFAGL